MRSKYLSFLSALVFLCQVQVGFADQVIDQFVILTHPLPWRTLGYEPTDPFPEGNYRTLEDLAYDRWLDAIPSLPASTFAIQVEFSPTPSTNQLLQAFTDRLGAGHLFNVTDNPVGGKYDAEPLITWYEGIAQSVQQQMSAQGLTYDPATANVIVWGESFEGCGSGHGSGIPYYLGLKTLTTFDYDMTVPDAPFLLGATFLQTVPVPASDVEAYIFDLNDGRLAALFRSTLTPQGLDYRPIELQLDPAIFSVLTKQGDTVWPQDPPPMRAQEVTFFTVHAQFLIAPKLNLSELLAAMKEAKVGSQTADSNSKGSG